jgi:hypothetical protein
LAYRSYRENHIVTNVLKRLRPLLIGLVVLLFTAGIAFAGKPSVPANGLDVASEASGKVVPVQADEGDEASEADEDTETVDTETVDTETVDTETVDTETVDTETEDAGGDNCATDPTGLSAEDLALLKHGSVVCWAAHQETPDGYANHGAWVSEWAKKNHGHQFGAAAPETTTSATTVSHGKGKSKNH